MNNDDERTTPTSPIPPSFDDFEETTMNGVDALPKPMKKWAESQSRRIRKVEKHFERGGMVAELHSDWTAVKKGVGFFKWAAPMVASAIVACIVGIIWLVTHAATQPPPPNAQDIAREVAKHQAAQQR
ncbi:MAG TPA: hypothetical protein VGH28_13755 [Polyangiaceae bacterium]|jgi:hypothetical protein